MRITAVHVRDYKRVREVAITPEGDRTLVLIGGENAQGKTSILDALSVAIGGKKFQAADPIRHGAEDAEIRIELDRGALTIRRTVTPSGGALEVREDGVPARAPQALLDKLIGARFMDPLAFLGLEAAKQRATLLGLIPDAKRLAVLEAERQRAFDARTEVNREVKRLDGALHGWRPPEAPAAIDVAAAVRRRDAIRDELAEGARLTSDVIDADRNVTALGAVVERLEDELARAKTLLDEAIAKAETASMLAQGALKREDVASELARLDTEIESAAEVNRRAAAAAAAVDAHGAQVLQHADHSRRAEQLTARLDAIESEKRSLLAAAELPVPGLGFDEAGITLNGVPLSQASGAERLRVALGLAMAASPGLDDIWIRDGALLDDRSLGLVADAAASMGKRVWIERVGDRDPGAIVIQDGQVRP